jgi:hypothetical protein
MRELLLQDSRLGRSAIRLGVFGYEKRAVLEKQAPLPLLPLIMAAGAAYGLYRGGKGAYQTITARTMDQQNAGISNMGWGAAETALSAVPFGRVGGLTSKALGAGSKAIGPTSQMAGKAMGWAATSPGLPASLTRMVPGMASYSLIPSTPDNPESFAPPMPGGMSGTSPKSQNIAVPPGVLTGGGAGPAPVESPAGLTS